ncbi:uncharacterized protein M6B38_173060 [Iris pallida]|uniref:Uncharacterized protein n=1 Tax=Iris pallida TaxID=29817 RepID=A0AAX6ESM8_IRIPA|nr:uncharacterized protein M6B38_173060 [Iris pallida]
MLSCYMTANMTRFCTPWCCQSLHWRTQDLRPMSRMLR